MSPQLGIYLCSYIDNVAALEDFQNSTGNINMQRISLLIGSALCSLAMIQTAHAGTFHQDWTYSIDAFTDGSGGDEYEIRGLATKETEDHIYISISGESALTGIDSPDAEDGNIGWGDLLFNFTDQDINGANGSLYGIRFAETNDSTVSQIGVFSDVTAASVSGTNGGFDHLQHYYESGWEQPNTMGDIATVQEAYAYIGETDPVLTSIIDGSFLGDIEFLSAQDASAAGLDFEYFNAAGGETHTFRLDRALLPGGDFIATLFLECANDGIALLSSFTSSTNNSEAQDVPEPSFVISLLTLGFLLRRKVSL